MAANRALSLATIETPFFGLGLSRHYVDPRVPILAPGNAHATWIVTHFLAARAVKIGTCAHYTSAVLRAAHPNAITGKKTSGATVIRSSQPGRICAPPDTLLKSALDILHMSGADEPGETR